MKTVFKLLLAIMPALFFSSCGEETATVAEIGFDADELVFEATEELEKSVTVSSNTYWRVSLPEDCDWLALSLRGAAAGQTELTLKANANSDEAERSTKLLFETLDDTIVELNVRQNGYVAPPPPPEPEGPKDLEVLDIGEEYTW